MGFDVCGEKTVSRVSSLMVLRPRGFPNNNHMLCGHEKRINGIAMGPSTSARPT